MMAPLTTFNLQHFDLSDLIKARKLIVVWFLASEMDKLEFPGAFVIEIDWADYGDMSLQYDINLGESLEVSNEESIDILDQTNIINPVGSLLKTKRKV